MSESPKNTLPPGKIEFPQFDQHEATRLIRLRRSVFPKDFSDEPVSRASVELILENAHWAPNHGKTEPWHFIVITGEARDTFGKAHADLYMKHTGHAEFDQRKYEKLARRPGECSHVIAICVKPGTNPKIPLIEETGAVACAVQNMYLTTAALGLAGYWSSGGMTYHPGMKEVLGLEENDMCLGFFMLGTPKDPEYYPKGYRKARWEEKVEWRE